jgi:class 3 adenylate cyclase
LTVLLCDVVGFTELANRVDPEILQKIICSYEHATRVTSSSASVTASLRSFAIRWPGVSKMNY